MEWFLLSKCCLLDIGVLTSDELRRDRAVSARKLMDRKRTCDPIIHVQSPDIIDHSHLPQIYDGLKIKVQRVQEG